MNMSEATETEQPGDGQDSDGLIDVLSSPLDNGDGLTAVLSRRPRAKLPSLTVVLVVVAVASAGFIGGIMVGKHYGSSGSGGLASRFGAFAAAAGASPSAGTGSGTRTGFGGAGGAGGAGGGFGGAGAGAGFGGAGGGTGGNATVGTIKLVDGSTVYVQTSAGDIVQVSTSSGTKVTASSTVPVKSLQPGEAVIVEGSKNSKGGVSATSISQTSAGAGLGG
jgi:hypothetical protein